MFEQAKLPDIFPTREVPDEEFLGQAENEIRRYRRLVVAGIIKIRSSSEQKPKSATTNTKNLSAPKSSKQLHGTTEHG